jgi:hypothetical protein
MLFSLWTGVPHRATSDLDLLGSGDNAVGALEAVFHEICQTPVEDDGLEFLVDSIRGEEIRDVQEYLGVRLIFTGRLAGARIPMQVDVGFGDAVIPQPETVDYPILLDFPTPRVLVYPREAVVAEKFQAMVILGIANSRMKDFYDLWTLARKFAFECPKLSAAIRATFNRRGTPIPTDAPLALTTAFADDATKQTQWSAFLNKGRLAVDQSDLGTVIATLREFLMPPTIAAGSGKPLDMIWPAGGPWQASLDKKWK